MMTANHMPPNPNDQIDYTSHALQSIYLAGGCFWGADAYLRRLKGVAATLSGYAQGDLANPSYESVCKGDTGHAETVKVDYAPDIYPLDALLREFFTIIDPTVKNRQGGDVGHQYRTGIYYTDPADLPAIEAVMAEIAAAYDKPIVTEIEPLRAFYPAEDYHQNYLEKNPGGYCHVDLSRLPKGE